MRADDYIKGRSYFGQPVYSPLALLLRPWSGRRGDSLCAFTATMVGKSLNEFGLEFPQLQEQARSAVGTGERVRGPLKYRLPRLEDDLRDRLRALMFHENGSGRAESRREAICRRSATIAAQVLAVLPEPPPAGFALLDVGCGDGLAATQILDKLGGRESLAVLTDVTDYRASTADKWMFVELPHDYEQFALAQRSAGHIDSASRFDVILLLTVLHHSFVPSRVVRACAEVAAAGCRIVVIESCVGIQRSHVQAITEEYRGGEGGAAAMRFADFELDEQLQYAAFVDWLYNRVFQQSNDVYVPCNFASPDEWNLMFEEFANVDVTRTVYSGFDQPLVPEFHTTHVLTVK